MPPPPTDAELIANFTPQEQKFHAWTVTHDVEDFRMQANPSTYKLWFQRHWPDPEERSQYEDWVYGWRDRHFVRMRYQIPASEFISLVRKTRFSDPASAAHLFWNMEMNNMPFVILGESDFGGVFTCYGLEVGANYLWPNMDGRAPDKELMERNVLGINTDVHVEYGRVEPASSTSAARSRKRRQEHSSGDDSVRSANSDDLNTPGGFVFAQLGVLRAFAGADWAASSKDPKLVQRGPWDDTGFGVVVQLSPLGRPGAVWVIYNFYQEEELDPRMEPEDPYPVDESTHPDDFKRQHMRVDDAFYGYPRIGRLQKNNSEMFTVAKIADSLDDLKEGKRFTFDVNSRKECQIVRAWVSAGPHGRFILRQWIKADN
ncbi:hypothetical protein G7046_g6247 [Stylonectria norvegica]|nr:hypothetical protein G7046_g6247 [Stylonectria norvegica]